MDHSINQQPDPFCFSNNFWGKEDNGVNVLLGHVNNTKHTADEIRAFYKERASIEEEYAKRLTALARKGLGSHEVGTLKSALDKIRSNTENLGKTHSNAAQQFKAELDEPLAAFSGTMRSRRKTVQSLMEKLNKAKLQQENHVERCREKFEGDCNKINGYFAQQNLLLGKELERNNQKLDKAHVSIEVTKRDYQNSIRVLAESIDRWTKEWKVSCDKLQDLEEERVNFLKSNLWAYTNIVSTVCVSDDEGCENIRVALEKCDVAKDTELFVRERGTGSEIMDPPEYVNFMNGISRGDTPRTYKIAQFARVSALEDPQDYFDPNVSMMNQSMMRNSASLARSSAASFMTEATDAQTVLINKGATSNLVAADNHQDPHSQSTNSADSHGSNFQSIPVLSHFQDGDYITSQSPQTQKQVISRQGSLYSSTSASSQSDIEQVNEHVYSQQQKPFNRSTSSDPPVIHEPVIHEPSHRAPSPQPQFQHEEKQVSPRRTWASPFRRRSKKDLRKGWNSNVSDAERSNTLTSNKFGFGSDDSHPVTTNATPTASPTKKGASTMLSMGDNMFDLGVSPRSPFDQRARTPSPVKSLAADDPLVMALEKLKVTSGGSSAPEEEHQPAESRNQYGGLSNGPPSQIPKRVSSRSAPVSPARNGPVNGSMRHGNNSATALVPPQPAFTAKEMRNTSGKYNNQTKELFEYDGAGPHGHQQRPRSNTGGSSRGPPPQRQGVSPQPSMASMRQSQRPHTMYDMGGNFQGHNQGGYSNGRDADFERRGSFNSRGQSPNPDLHGIPPPPRGNSVSPAPFANDMRRSMSPNPVMMRGSSPNPQMQQNPGPSHDYRRSASPNPGYQDHFFHRQQSHQNMYQDFSRDNSNMPSRGVSPHPYQQPANEYQRAGSARGNYYGGNSQYNEFDGNGRDKFAEPPRSKSALNMRGGGSPAPATGHVGNPGGPAGPGGAGLPNVSRDGRPILRYSRAAYDYRAAIPEEVSFRAGDVLLVVRMLEDGWWEAEVLNDGRMGLAPSNFLKNL